jgi:hypothetical protein
MDSKRSRSYPERLSDIKDRENNEVLNQFKEKDQCRTEQLAIGGSSNSIVYVHPPTCRKKLFELFIRWGNYMLERGEKERADDLQISQKSYAGFYYFIKWFIRSIFFLIFTTVGSIGGKEIGCEIRDHHTCSITAVDLAGNSPHILSTIFGFIFGLFAGQWLGRLFWDHLTEHILYGLRRIEKCADRSKACLYIISILVYIVGITSFGFIFFFFVRIGSADDNVIGGFVGGLIGLACAVFAYRKNSNCRSGEQTPMIRVVSPIFEPPELKI